MKSFLLAYLAMTLSAVAGQWTYTATSALAGKISHNTKRWELKVAVSGTNLTVTSVHTLPSRAEELLLGDEVKGGYRIVGIGDMAFYNCARLSKVSIPASVAKIGTMAFYGCPNLAEISVAAGSPAGVSIDGVLFNKAMTELVLCPIRFNDGDNGYVVPDGVERIGDYAFSGCSGVTSIKLPASVKSIGSSAFSGCTRLAGVELPDGLDSIGSSAFSGCSRLTEISLPDSVTSIGADAFAGCSRLSDIVIGNGVTRIGSYAFSSCSSLANIQIGANVSKIEDYAFYGCSRLTNVAVVAENMAYANIDGVLFNKAATELLMYPVSRDGPYVIPDGVERIGADAFSGCTGLASVTIPNSVVQIGDYAFRGCSSLTSVVIPDSVTHIGGLAFVDCVRLTRVSIGSGVVRVGSTPFGNCLRIKDMEYGGRVPEFRASKVFPGSYKLWTSLNIRPGVEEIGDGAFEGCSSLASVSIPDSVRRIGAQAFRNCSSLASVTIPDSVESIENGAFSLCVKLDGVVIPDSVKRIGDSAFAGCSAMSKVSIGSGVEVVSISAFTNCAKIRDVEFNANLYLFRAANMFPNSNNLWTNLVIGANVSNIDAGAFYGCHSLSSVTIGSGVTRIHKDAFTACAKIRSMTFNADMLTFRAADSFPDSYQNWTDLVIGAGVTRIARNAFSGCSRLVSAMISDTVEFIDSGAFSNCLQLESLIFKGACPGGELDLSGGHSFVTTYISSEHAESWAPQIVNGPVERGVAIWRGRPIRLMSSSQEGAGE